MVKRNNSFIKKKKDKSMEKLNTENIIKNIGTNEEFDNFELNELDFQRAIKLDNRTFIQIYLSNLKREHPILFTFFSFNDYNLIYIKLARFIFLMTTDMALNVFFFSDESMHKLYIDYGKYDFIQKIPQILYSTIISKIFEIFLCYLSLTDKPIYKLKKLKIDNPSKTKEFKCINNKLIIFFIFTSMFMLFYWYVVSAFCVVYKNTQITFIKDWIFSFILGILLPFIIYLIPSALRIYALKNKNDKGAFCLYRLSEIIPFF